MVIVTWTDDIFVVIDFPNECTVFAHTLPELFDKADKKLSILGNGWKYFKECAQVHQKDDKYVWSITLRDVGK